MPVEGQKQLSALLPDFLGEKPSLSLEQINDICELTEKYIQIDAIEFTEDDLIENLFKLCELSKVKAEAIDEKDSHRIEEIALSARIFSGSESGHSHTKSIQNHSIRHFSTSKFTDSSIVKNIAQKTNDYLNREYRTVLKNMGLKRTASNISIIASFDRELKAAGEKEGAGYNFENMLQFSTHKRAIKDTDDLRFFCEVLLPLRREAPFYDEKAIIMNLAHKPWQLANENIQKLLVKCDYNKKDFIDEIARGVQNELLENDRDIRLGIGEGNHESFFKIAEAAVKNEYCSEAVFPLLYMVSEYYGGIDELVRVGVETISKNRLLKDNKKETNAKIFFDALVKNPLMLRDDEIRQALLDSGKSEEYFVNRIGKETKPEIIENAMQSQFLMKAVSKLFLRYQLREEYIHETIAGSEANPEIIARLAGDLKTDEKMWFAFLSQYARHMATRIFFFNSDQYFSLPEKIINAFEQNECYKILLSNGRKEDLEKFWRAIGLGFLFGEKDSISIRTFVSINQHIKQIIDLERKRPGIFHKLFTEQGITHFERHSKEVLIAQFDEFGKRSEKPLLILLEADEDWNGAFGRLGSEVDHLGSMFDIRIYGAATKTEAARRLISASQTYGKIDVLFLAGHGSEDGVGLRHIDTRGAIGANDLLKSDFSRLFSDKPSVIFLSCSTGAENGILWQISDIYSNATFQGPTKPSAAKQINYLGMKGGRHAFELTYSEEGIGAKYEGKRQTEIKEA